MNSTLFALSSPNSQVFKNRIPNFASNRSNTQNRRKSLTFLSHQQNPKNWFKNQARRWNMIWKTLKQRILQSFLEQSFSFSFKKCFTNRLNSNFQMSMQRKIYHLFNYKNVLPSKVFLYYGCNLKISSPSQRIISGLQSLFLILWQAKEFLIILLHSNLSLHI